MTARRSTRFLRSRQASFFLVAIGLPCAVLALLTERMLVQDRELAEKRLADIRRQIAVDVRQTLLGEVERLRLTALNPSADRAVAVDSGSPIALIAAVQGGRLVLPWETEARRAAVALDEPRFRNAVRIGEEHEFLRRDFAAAAAAYQRAALAGQLPVQQAWAQLLAARAWTKGARWRDAGAAISRLLEVSPAVVDDEGVPFALYGARLIADARGRIAIPWPHVLDTLDRVVSSPAASQVALYTASDAAAELASRDASPHGRTAAAIAGRAKTRADDLEHALALRTTFHALGVPVSGIGGEPVWISAGDVTHRWLLNITESGGAPALTVLRATPVLRAVQASARLAHLGGGVVSIGAADGEPLGPNFPGLKVALADTVLAALSKEQRLRRPFSLAALAVVVGLALSGAYLFWRDVQRDVRLAALRSEFVSSVSHELRTPLTAIRMFAETVLMGRAADSSVQREYLETIVNESERLTRLLNNVLDFSNIEQGRKTYRLVPQSLAPVVRAAANTMQYPLAQQGFDLRVDVDEDVPPVAADADAIEQAVLNLLSNAMKYSGGARAIAMSLRRDGECAVIAVTDGGIGIAPEHHARLFDKFYRVRDAATERIPGTGLGLTLVAHLARAHGGSVRVDSSPGNGSTFSLVLPLARAQEHVRQPSATGGTAEPVTTT